MTFVVVDGDDGSMSSEKKDLHLEVWKRICIPGVVLVVDGGVWHPFQQAQGEKSRME